MTELISKKDLKAIGVSASIVGVVIIVATGFWLYRNYKETQKLTLEIKKLKKELA